jgi:polar amino acid transport system permease protein
VDQVIQYYLNWEIIRGVLPSLVRALWVVVQMVTVSLVLSFILGLGLSLLRISKVAPLRWLATGYIDFFRGVPLLLVLTFIYYALALVGSQTGISLLILPPIQAAILSLTLVYGAYSAEIFRAGIGSVHRGQMEAARSLGMTYAQAMRYVVLPQAIRVVIPPLTSELISLIKDTSLASVITVQEVLFVARQRMGIAANPSPLTAAAIIYLMFTLPLIRIAGRLERRGVGARKPVGM